MSSLGDWQQQGVGCPLDTQCIDRQAQQNEKIFPPATSSMVSMVMRLKVGSSSISRQELRRTSVKSNRSYEGREERTLQNSTQTCTQMNSGNGCCTHGLWYLVQTAEGTTWFNLSTSWFSRGSLELWKRLMILKTPLQQTCLSFRVEHCAGIWKVSHWCQRVLSASNWW